MDKSTQQENSSQEVKTFLFFFQEYEQIQQLTSDEINRMKQILAIKRAQQQRLNQKPDIPKQQTNPNVYHKELALLSNYANKDKCKKITIPSKNTQKQHISQQVIRKSRRLLDKGKRKQYLSQPPKNYTSMIKKIQKQYKSEQTKQFNRPFVERLKNPGKPTLRETQIMFKNNQFYYSINIKSHQYCTKHKIDKKSIQNSSFSKQQQQLKSSFNCRYCKKIGTYWFSSEQLLKFNNGNFIRRYLETFI